MTSLQPKILGALSILLAVAGALKAVLDNDPSTNADWGAVSAAVTAGVALFTVRQNNVRSEVVEQVKEMVPIKPEYLPPLSK